MINSKQFLNGLSHQLGVITPDFLPIYSFFSQKRIVPKDNYSFACEAKGIGKNANILIYTSKCIEYCPYLLYFCIYFCIKILIILIF